MAKPDTVPLPFDSYEPGQFADIAATPLAQELWVFIATQAHIEAMLRTADQGIPPIEVFCHELQERFGERIAQAPFDDERIRVMVNNMIKQILGRYGYELSACCIMQNCPFCHSSGLYRRTAVKG